MRKYRKRLLPIPACRTLTCHHIDDHRTLDSISMHSSRDRVLAWIACDNEAAPAAREVMLQLLCKLLIAAPHNQSASDSPSFQGEAGIVA